MLRTIVFHNPEGVVLQEVYHLFSGHLVVLSYQNPLQSVAMISSCYHPLLQHGVHYTVDQRLGNQRPAFRHVLQGPLEAHRHMHPYLSLQGLKEDGLQKDYMCSLVALRCAGRKC